MGGTTVKSTDHPANESADHPAKKKKKRNVSTSIALGSAIIAIAAAVISGLQVNLANKQNTEAQQAQLSDLTVTIAQQVSEVSALTSQTGSANTKTATAS